LGEGAKLFQGGGGFAPWLATAPTLGHQNQRLTGRWGRKVSNACDFWKFVIKI